MSSNRSLRLGVNLGGTKTEAVVLRMGREAPEVLARLRVATEQQGGYDHIVARTARLVADVAAQAGLASLPPVGVGMPGGVTFRAPGGEASPVPLVKNSNTTCLNGRPFRGDLTAAVAGLAGARPEVAFANDANCFALAETRYGAARGARVAFGVIMGTGVGGGVVLRHGEELEAWDGLHGIAGEWGHVVLEPDAPQVCYCGRRGCIETLISGPAIEAAYARRAGVRRPLPEIASLVDAKASPVGDDDARAVLQEVVDRFGRALAIVVNVLDPDVIVLGGGVSNLDVLYDAGRAALARNVFNDELRTPLVKNALGDSAGVFGAALLNTL